MRAGWQVARLGDVIHVLSGFAFKSTEYTDCGHFLIRIGNVQSQGLSLDKPKYVQLDSKTRRFELNVGDILTSLTGNVGRVAVVQKKHLPAALNQRVAKLTLKDNSIVIREFLYYFLASEIFREELNKTAHGVAQKNVSPKAISSIQIALPNLSEQKRIVAILDEAFAGIDTAVANTKKNLANARELFESYLSLVFSQRGEGWQVKSVGEFADHCLGKMLDKQKNKGELRPYLRNVNVQWFEIHTDDVLKMRIESHEEERFSVKDGDLLICEGGYPGRAAIWSKDAPMFFQKALHRVRCNDIRLNRWLLYYLYLSDSNGELTRHFTGAGIQHFTGRALKAFRVPLPPAHRIDDLLTGIEAVRGEAANLESIYQQKLTALAELKQSLLQKAFSGELTTRTVENAKDVAA